MRVKDERFFRLLFGEVFLSLLLVLSIAPCSFAAEAWESSEHGKMLKRILPPGPAPEQLPEAQSTGARLLERYCVQCHYLPDPRMHAPKHWPNVVERMVRRIRGEGNLGPQMKELMENVEAPDDNEVSELNSYLQRHGQQPIEVGQYADLNTQEGRAFSQACSQCHTLPDPKSHTAQEWPEVVERMKKHLLWIGVVSSNRAIGKPSQFSAKEILDFLKRNSCVP
ncbi:MAG: hypothetical protein ACREV0_10975 [Burkholderiales bacterium]